MLICHQASEHIDGIQNDTTKVEAFRIIGNTFYRLYQPDTAIIFLEQGIRLARQIKYQKGIAFLLNGLGSAYRRKKEIDKAEQYYEESFEFNKSLGNTGGQTVALNNLGNIFLEDRKDSEKAIAYYTQALEIQRTTGNKKYQAGILYNIGLVYNREGNYPESTLKIEEALQLYQEINDINSQIRALTYMSRQGALRGDYARALDYYLQLLDLVKIYDKKTEESKILTEIANMNTDFGHYEESIVYTNKAMVIWKELGDIESEATGYNNIGRNLIFLGKYKEALEYLFLSLRSHQKSNRTEEIPFPLYNIGDVYEKLGQLDSALIYLYQALELAEETDNIYIQTLVLTDLAKVYAQQNERKQALNLLLKANSLSDSSQYLPEKRNIALELYKLYKVSNQPGLALKYHERYQFLQDSLQSTEKTRAIAMIEANYQFDQEKQQLALTQNQILAQERIRRRNILIALIISIAFMLLLAWLYRTKQVANQKTLEQNRIIEIQNTELKDSQKKLKELDQAKSRLYTNITHEFRTPLTVILGLSRQLETAFPKRPEILKKLKLIHRNGQNLLDLINQILDLSKLEKNELRINFIQGDIISYIHYITESFHSLANTRNILLRVKTEEGRLNMDYDPEKIKQILANLISNAIKYTPSGGKIFIEISKLNPSSVDDLSFIQIKIRDTGSGIPAEDLPNIFDRFYQADDQIAKTGGTGIGLALTKELVKLLEGTIHVESQVGEGTTFILALPISQIAEKSPSELYQEERAFPVATVQLPKGNTNGQPLSDLLIIEDNPDVVEYLSICLQGHYNLDFAYNGRIGLEKAFESVPDIIISDVMMPEKDGFDVCDNLKNDIRTSHIPVILLTAKADIESRIAGLKRGADAYLKKPFHQEELLVVLENLLAIRQKLQIKYAGINLASGELKAQIEEPPPAEIEDAFLLKIKSIVEENLSDPNFSMNYLERAMGLSRSQLFRKIKALTGKSPSTFIRSIRLHHARKMLETSNLNVSEIAYEVGFSTPAYFSTAFLEEFGFQPGTLKK